MESRVSIAARMISTAHRFDPVRVSIDYSSHPTSGTGRWRISLRRTGMTGSNSHAPYSHEVGGGLDVCRAIVAGLFPGAVIEHESDNQTGYRFRVYPTPPAWCATHGEYPAGDECPGWHPPRDN